LTRAVFLDRDGTLTPEEGPVTKKDHPKTLLPGVSEGTARLSAAGFRLVVVTNQSAVARGRLTEKTLARIHANLRRLLPSIDAVYHCPHHPKGSVAAYARDCSCRKPKPGMILAAASELDLDPAGSFLLGDDIRDIEAGTRAGCKTIHLATGFGCRDRDAVRRRFPETPMAADFLDAVRMILDQEKPR